MILSHPSLISNYFHPILDTCTAKLMLATVNIGLRKKKITLTFLFIQIAQRMSSSFIYLLESLFRIQIRVNYFDNKTKIKPSFIKRFVIFYQEILNMYKFKLGSIAIYYSLKKYLFKKDAILKCLLIVLNKMMFIWWYQQQRQQQRRQQQQTPKQPKIHLF